jgi:tyramine---L-glutamate ligase
LKILLYEHISSGGLSGCPLQSSILSEGYGMLRSLSTDLKEAGHSTSILLDSRVADLTPHFQGTNIIKIHSQNDTKRAFKKASKTVDAAFIIAPENNNILQSIIEDFETMGLTTLNSGSKAVEEASKKENLPQRIKELGLNFPKTITFQVSTSENEIIQSIKSSLGFPVIIKSSTGTGCSGLSIARTEKKVAEAIKKIRKETLSDSFLAQEYVQGVDASVSLLCTGADVVPISLNSQDVTLSDPTGSSSYNGGSVSYQHPRKEEAFNAAQKLILSFKKMKGYIGVDCVLTKDKAVIMEINPRITTSYIGLRKIVNVNLSQVIIDSILKQEIPSNLKTHGVAMFSKVRVNIYPIANWEKICDMPQLISPPFPIIQKNPKCALIQSMGSNAEEAKEELERAKERLGQILIEGGQELR